ncbi:hypothetical protein KXW87_001198, partial [Aspergillus fumigatus]
RGLSEGDDRRERDARTFSPAPARSVGCAARALPEETVPHQRTNPWRVPSPNREAGALDNRGLAPARDGTAMRDAAFVRQSITSMRISTGQHMTQSISSRRRPLGREKLLLAALLIAPAFIATTASAQTLGYAPLQPNFPSDYVTSDESTEAVDAPVPERLRRAVVAFDTREAP